MRERFFDKLNGVSRKYGSFSEECLKFCGRVLKKVEKEFKHETLRRGVKKAFLETVMSSDYEDACPHSHTDFPQNHNESL